MGNAMQPNQQYSKARIGLMIFAVLACSIITGFGNFKLIPMQSAIMQFFNVAEGAYGILNTASSWITVFCAIPLGFLVRKLPCNWSMVIGFGVSLVGIFIQTVAGVFPLFVVGRMIEGAGSGIIALVTGSLILTLVDKKRMVLWSSLMIMATVVPQVVMAKGGTALMINSGLSFQAIFRIIGIIYVVFLIVWLVLVPFSLRASGVQKTVKPTKERTMRVYRNKNNWLISIAFIFFNAASITFTSYVIYFLTTKGLDQTTAANYYSYSTILGLAAMIFFGWLSDKLKTKRKIAIMSYFAGAAAFVLLGVLPANLIIIYVIVWGTFPRSIAGLTSASAMDIAEDPMDVPIVTSTKNTITGIGTIVVGILMGILIQNMGYEFTIYLLAAGLALGGVLWIFARKIP